MSLLAALSELLLYNSFFFVQVLRTIRLSQQSSVVLCLSGGEDVVHGGDVAVAGSQRS